MMRGGSRSGMACCFVRYALQEEANAAIAAVHGKHVPAGATDPLVVRFADTPGSGRGRKSRSGAAGGTGSVATHTGAAGMVGPGLMGGPGGHLQLGAFPPGYALPFGGFQRPQDPYAAAAAAAAYGIPLGEWGYRADPTCGHARYPHIPHGDPACSDPRIASRSKGADDSRRHLTRTLAIPAGMAGMFPAPPGFGQTYANQAAMMAAAGHMSMYGGLLNPNLALGGALGPTGQVQAPPGAALGGAGMASHLQQMPQLAQQHQLQLAAQQSQLMSMHHAAAAAAAAAAAGGLPPQREGEAGMPVGQLSAMGTNLAAQGGAGAGAGSCSAGLLGQPVAHSQGALGQAQLQQQAPSQQPASQQPPPQQPASSQASTDWVRPRALEPDELSARSNGSRDPPIPPRWPITSLAARRHLSRLRMGARTTTTQRRASAHGRSLSDVPPRGLADGALSLGSGLLLATGNGELTCVMPSDAAPGKRATFRAVYRHHSAFTASPDRLRTRPITTAILRRASEPDAALTEPHAPRGPAARPRPRRPCRTT